MAKNNSINVRTSEITLDPGASGDSFIQFDINATGEFRIGVDDDASETFKISQGSALGTNDTFVMTSAGEITLPLNPAFSAYLSSTSSNATGDGTAVSPVIMDSENFDQGGDFNTTTGVFTAPSTGNYYLTFAASLEEATSSFTSIEVRLITSNRTYQVLEFDLGNAVNASDEYRFNHSVLADMDSGDTYTNYLVVAGSTLTVDIVGSATSTLFTYVSGFLAL